MRARYIYSACVVVETDDAKICCDPWFTPGIYDGSWFQYPVLDRNPVEVVGSVDAIYISHIHPDHYDVAFLRRYLAAYPEVRILIGDTSPPHLARKMKIDGFTPETVAEVKLGGTIVTVIPNHAFGEAENIDTALVVAQGGQSVVNMNDNPLDLVQVQAVLAACPAQPTVAFLPYSGAGPYPQTYEFAAEADQRVAADQKRARFLATYTRYIEVLDPERAVPFAGKYFLAGPLRELNGLRGVPDAVEAAERVPARSVVLADGGDAYIDLDTMGVSEERARPYDDVGVDAHLSSLDFPGYDYEREIAPLDSRSLPLLPILSSAYTKAISRSRTLKSFWFCISTSSGRYLCFDTSCDSGVIVRCDVSDLEPRSEIYIDDRYLFGLLVRLYHWNNAEIGSHYKVRRVPDIYRREVYGFLHRLHV